MLTYDTIKQLKKAGFPNKTKTHSFDWYLYSEPNLSDLIRTCGDGIDALLRIQDTNGHKWRAIHSNGIKKPEDDGLGKTPEEAVAKLWLEIKKQ